MTLDPKKPPVQAATGPGVVRPPVLLVDDLPANLLALEEILSGLDLTPVRAGSGEEAAAHLLKGSFAAILLDVRMTGMDGFETAALIRTRHNLQDLPILFMTAHDLNTADIRRGYTLGAVDFISKPIIPEVVRAKVSFFLELYRKNLSLQARETLLQESEALAHLGSWEWEPATGHVTWSDELFRIYGAAPGSFQPTFSEFLARIHPEDRSQVQLRLEQALKDGRPFDQEERVVRPDGSVRILQSRGRVLLDPSRKPLRVIGSCLDITDRKALEGREARAHLASVVDSTSDAVITKGLDGIVRTWNPGAERIFGYTAAEAIGQHISFLFPPDHVDEEAGIIARIRQGNRIEHYETVRRRKDGTLIDVSLSVSPLRDAFDNLIGASKIGRDITERKRAEAEIRELNASLERRVQERTLALKEAIDEMEAFMYTVAHDLRAPLRAMAGYSTLLLDPATAPSDPAERETYLRGIISGARNMDALIQDLLAFGHLARSEVRCQTTDLDAAVRAALHRFEAEVARLGALVRIDSPLGRVHADPEKLNLVLENLVSNALKFVPQDRKPEVRIRTERSGKGVRLWMEDNGIGIAREFHERIWGVFERLNRSEEYPGTGMGLAIVKRALERMGGKSGVDSQQSKGSRFWIELPTEPASGPR